MNALRALCATSAPSALKICRVLRLRAGSKDAPSRFRREIASLTLPKGSFFEGEAAMAARRSRGLDAIDVKILAALQRDGRMTNEALAERVSLTARPCLERVRRLHEAGIISGFQAVIDVERLSRPVTVVSEIALDSQARRDQVERRLRQIDEIVECWEVSGAFDYIARIVCADLGRYEELTAELLDDPVLGVGRVVSHVVLRSVRRFAGYPAQLLAPRSR
jgi:DNA-binding Lrp family transcriptional regulator